ncbi:MAG: sialate O-acetylesterase [bacterium]|nr:sialate O-acetylesterase [bacterium]
MARRFQLGILFQDHMMFQINQEITISGISNIHQMISVEFLDYVYQKEVPVGPFTICLPAVQEYFEPFEMKISTLEEVVLLRDCIFGDIFIAGGQSNMAFVLKDCVHDELITNPLIRYFKVPELPYEGAQHDYPWAYQDKPSWGLATLELIPWMSAIAYEVATALFKETKRPIGIITVAMGDTSVFSWTDLMSLQGNNRLSRHLNNYQFEVEKYRSESEYTERFHTQFPMLMNFYGVIEEGVKAGLDASSAHAEAYRKYPNPYLPMGPMHHNRPSGCFDTMIKRIIPYSCKAILYYQGESDHENHRYYESALRTMIASWRIAFEMPHVPFYLVQIAGYAYPGAKTDAIPFVRFAQQQVALKEPHVYLVSAIDQGEIDNIHPVDKRIVAKRIVDCVLEYSYGQKSDTLSPYVSDYMIQEDLITLSIKGSTIPLVSKSGVFKGILVSSNHQAFEEVMNVRVGNQTITFPIEKDTKEIRYLFDNAPSCDIYTEHGLPLLPFRFVFDKH